MALRVVALLASAGATVWAEVPSNHRVRLEWTRGAGADVCPTAQDIRADVAARLGRDPFDASAPRAIEGIVDEQASTLVAHLYLRDETGKLVGTRELKGTASDCRSLGAAVTLAMALVIDPEATLHALPPTPSPPSSSAPGVPERPATVSPLPQADVTREVVAPGEKLPRPVALEVAGVLALGLLPDPAPGAMLSGNVAVKGPLHASVGMLFLPEERPANGRFAFGLTAALIEGCDVLGSSRVALSVCAGVDLGALHSVVYTLVPTSPGDRLWIAAAVEGRLRLRVVGPLSADLRAGAEVPLIHQRFSIVGSASPAFDEPALGGIGSLGLSVGFP